MSMRIGLLLLFLVAIWGHSNPTDSLRILLLEAKLAQHEEEKGRLERERAEVRFAKMESEILRLASSQPTLNANAIWGAGHKIQSSIWLQVAGMGLTVLGGVGAASDSPGLAYVGTIGGTALNIIGIVQLFEAGTELKRASNAEPETPIVKTTPSGGPLFRDGKSPDKW